MLFILLRFLPYAIPLAYFASLRLVFYYNDQWSWFFYGMLALIAAYFVLLKYKNPRRQVALLAAFALVFAATGFAYALILENSYIISLFLLGWSLILGLYLEAVFHDFYKTAKAYVLSLSNIALYGGILTVFFLTAAMNSFNIFLSLKWYYLLPGLAIAYAIISLLTVLRHNGGALKPALLNSGIISLIMLELTGGLMILPCSFYVIAIVAALAYYSMITLLVASQNGRLNRRELWRLLGFVGAGLAIALLTANWL